MDIEFMRLALDNAEKAKEIDEVPVGAVIVKDGEVIGSAFNTRETSGNAVNHAEIIAIGQACEKVGNWRLIGCDMYVTLEPCAMCTGAIINARIDNVYFGAYDKKAGCCGTVYDLINDNKFNHKPNVIGGIMEEECSNILSSYFKTKREKKC